MTSGPAVPANVATAVRQRWPDRGPHWVHKVEPELRELCARHGVEPREVLPARYGFVVVVVGRRGKLVMRASPDPNGENQAKVAVTLGDIDVGPRVHDVLATDTGTWTVMERIEPGCSFSDIPPSGEVLGLLAHTLSLMSHGQAPTGLPKLTDWLHDRLVADDLLDLPAESGPAHHAGRAHALEVLAELAIGSSAGLGHGDLSPGNVLYRADGRFFLVDPRGMGSDVAYDVAVLSSKAPQYGQPPTVANQLADALQVDHDRVHAWLAVAEAARV